MSEIVVIGGGVVGLTSAWWLAEAGFQVRLVEREAQVGSMASYQADVRPTTPPPMTTISLMVQCLPLTTTLFSWPAAYRTGCGTE